MKIIAVLLGTLIFLAGCAAVIFALPRPQDPRDRPYRIEAAKFEGSAGVTLVGELTLPRSDGPFKAVILISGSGPMDRNEAMFGHRPFLVLSDHLTRAGFAVLRYDDRGVGDSTGDFESASMNDFADDAAGAFHWLAANPDIDNTAIGFIGDSEGGYVAPAAALKVPAAFMVFLAGPAKRLLPDIMATQAADILREQGASEATIMTARKQYEEATKILAGPGTDAEIRAKLDEYLANEGQTERQRASVLDFLANPWGIGYATYDPVPALRAFNGPVLALFGTTDLQVSATENAPVMLENLINSRSEVILFEGLNHFFQPSESGSISEYMWIDTTIDPEVLNRISDWMKNLYDASSGNR